MLAGKDLAKEARQEAKEAQKAEGLEPAWTVSGPSSGVAADPKGQTVYAVQNRGHCDVLDTAGKTIRSFQINSHP